MVHYDGKASCEEQQDKKDRGTYLASRGEQVDAGNCDPCDDSA
jgi:hypothetical protein